jgi:hypothetical protein
MGSLDGVFIYRQENWDKILEACENKTEVYFGEVLGKHSEIYGNLHMNAFEVLSEDQELCKKLLEVFPNGYLSGHNPLDYIDNE